MPGFVQSGWNPPSYGRPCFRCQMVADYFQNDIGLNEDQLCRQDA